MKKVKSENEEIFSVMSYNINGLKSVLSKSFVPYTTQKSCDVVFLSETKYSETTPIASFSKLYPHQYYNPSSKKGYSSVALFSKVKPNKVSFKLEGAPDSQGRCITAFFDKKICLIGLYVLNSGANLIRLSDRTKKFDKALISHIKKIKNNYSDYKIIICGDLNVAYLENDIYNPNEARNKIAGFTNDERINFNKILNLGFTDSYLHKNPSHLWAEEEKERNKGYTWYSARLRWERGGNKGWRLDYFLVDSRIEENILEVEHEQKIDMSDHIPIILKLKI